jgi:hypothetical protein
MHGAWASWGFSLLEHQLKLICNQMCAAWRVSINCHMMAYWHVFGGGRAFVSG